MPQDLYDLMVDALRNARAVPVSAEVPLIAPIAPSIAPIAPPAAPPLPAEVADACDAFGFGDREETSANYRKASELWAKGRPAKDIVTVIRQGADVNVLYV